MEKEGVMSGIWLDKAIFEGFGLVEVPLAKKVRAAFMEGFWGENKNFE